MLQADDKRGDWMRKAFREYYGIKYETNQDKLSDRLIAQVMACKSDEARRLIFGACKRMKEFPA